MVLTPWIPKQISNLVSLLPPRHVPKPLSVADKRVADVLPKDRVPH
jgi:hypothetical protein